MIRKIFALTSLAAAIAFAVPASAGQVLTFSGTLNNQSKNGSAGPFGASNAVLQGQAFAVELEYDLALFAGTSNCGMNASAACTFTLNAGRTITQSVTIGGVTKTYVLNSGSFTLNSNGNDNFAFGITGNGITSLQGNFTATNANANGFFPTVANVANVSNAAFNSFPGGIAVQNATFNQTTSNQTTTGFNIQAAGGTITSFSATNRVAGVPEPATWALMILGFGFVGAAMRSARHAKVQLRLV